jgi:hypothetical protein
MVSVDEREFARVVALVALADVRVGEMQYAQWFR